MNRPTDPPDPRRLPEPTQPELPTDGPGPPTIDFEGPVGPRAGQEPAPTASVEGTVAAGPSLDVDPYATVAHTPSGQAAGPAPGGITFGPYDLIEEVARGGMGVIWKARDRRLQRVVALKMILTGTLAREDDVRRFRSESESVAHLDHPGIVPIYDVGEVDGQHYFTMKFLEGGSLSQVGPRIAREPRAVARTVADLARAMHHAHERGILHRDLKPANILFDKAGVPHVSDFGLAKRYDGQDGQTQSGAILGTPGYMSPEQAAGKVRDLGPATDVYGLGAILFELLTGRVPFRGDSVMGTLHQILNDEPPTPRSINPKADRDLGTIALKCLRKGPERRYPSALALAEDLERWLDGRPILARRTGVARRSWKALRRRPATLGCAGCAAASLLGFFGLCVAVSVALIPAAQAAREAARRAQCGNNLKQIGIALHNYHDRYGAFPPAAIASADGRPLLSWRVAILPFLPGEGEALYSRFRLDEPWDSPHNKALLAARPFHYACPSEEARRKDGEAREATTYLGVVGPGAMFDPGATVHLVDVRDGTANTLQVIEGARSVPWSAPEDLAFDPAKEYSSLKGVVGAAHPGGFQGLFADGSVAFLREEIAGRVKKMLTRDGGEYASRD